MKGMRVYIYKTKDFESCSNEGLSSKYNQATLVGPGVPEIFKPDDHAPAIKLDQSIADHPRHGQLITTSNAKALGICLGVLLFIPLTHVFQVHNQLS